MLMQHQQPRLITPLAAVTVALLGSAASAVPLYSQNFDVDDTANWTFNSSIGGDTAANNSGGEANYFFDYSTVGIPAAPGSGGTTRGLKLEVNIPGTATFSGMSTSPTALSLPSEYILTAHVWQNSVGAITPPGFPGGGSGSTQLTNMTVGASGTDASFAGGTLTGVQGSVTGEGGSGTDWRIYSAAFPDGAGSIILPNAHPGVYAAGNAGTDTNNTAAHYASNFPGSSPPAAQTGLFPQQNGTTQNGTPAFKWRLWEIVKTSDEITWSVDGVLIATLPSSLFPGTFGNNIAFGQMDINTTSSTDANARSLLFGLIDNIEVNPIPEPAALSLLALGAMGLRRRRA